MIKQKQNRNPLTWDELADAYDKEHTGRKARTLPMNFVFDWAENQRDKFEVDFDGSIYLKVVK